MTVADAERTYRILHEARAGSKSMTAEVLWALPRVGAPVPSPDGTHLAIPVTTCLADPERQLSRIYLVPTSGGDARPVTAEERFAVNPVFAPDGSHLAFLARPVEDKQAPMQLHVLPLDGGEARCLTDLPLGAYDMRWLPDGSGFVLGVWLFEEHFDLDATREEADRRKDEPIEVFATEARMFRFWDRWLVGGKIPHLFHFELDTGALHDLMPESTLWGSLMEPAGAFDVSPEGDEAVFLGTHVGGPDNRLRSDVFRVRVADPTAPVECLTAGDPAYASRPRYTPCGAAILYGRSEDPDFYADRVRVMRIDRKTGEQDCWLGEWDRSPGGWTFGEGSDLWFHAENDGAQGIYRLSLRDAHMEGALPEVVVPGGTCSQPRPAADGFVYFHRHAVSEPPEVWRVSAAGGAAERVTTFTEDVLADVALGEVRDYRFRGAEDEEVQVVVILPPGHDSEAPLPLVHMIHGGPHGQFGDLWHFRWSTQSFAAPGYAVACVNFQGSTSWGNDFAKRIQGEWGKRPYEDVIKATDHLIAAGLVDESKMAISGGSYGGYLTSWIATQTDRFACAVNHAGVFDLPLQYASDSTWGRARNMGGEIWEDPETVDRYNPVRHTQGLNTPMLVIHGEKDYRVPVNQALECYGVLKARGVESRLLYFADENHWILKRRNSLLWYEEVLGWFARFLD